MPAISKNSVNYLSVDEAAAGQRLDNFLIRLLKGVPKSHIHRIIRGGEVRVNKKRAAADSRLAVGDEVRIPPSVITLAMVKVLPKPVTPNRV